MKFAAVPAGKIEVQSMIGEAMKPESESTVIRALRLVVLLSGGALASMVQAAVTPAMAQMAADLGRGNGDGVFFAQNVVTVPALALAVGAPIIGWLSGLIGKRAVMCASLLIFAVAGTAGYVLSDFVGLLISRLLVGVAAAGYITTAIASIGDHYTGTSRDRLISWFSFLATVGALTSMWAAGQISAAYGWHAQFLLYLVGAPLLLLSLYTIRPVRLVVIQPSADRPAAHGAASILGAWRIYLVVLVLGISMWATSLQGTFLLAQRGYPDPSTVANILIFSPVGAVLGAFAFSFIRPVLGFQLVLAIVCGAFAVANIGFALAHDIVMLRVLAVLGGVGAGLFAPLTQAAVLNIVSSKAAAGAVGVVIGCSFLGQFVNPPVVKILSGIHGTVSAVIDIGLTSFVGAVLAVAWWLIAAMRKSALSRQPV